MSTQSTKPIFPEPQHFPEVEAAPADSQPIAPPPLPHVEHSYTPEVFVCVRCGSTNIAHGSLVDFSGAKFENVKFAPKRISLRLLNWALRPQTKLLDLKAEACRDCGAVLMTVDTEELRRTERRRR